MFKKKPTIKPLAPLRSSDRRKTADRIISDYGLQTPPVEASSAEEKAAATTAHSNLRSSLLPDNVQTARFTTTHGPDLKQVSGTIYVGSYSGDDHRILWFKIEERIYPSVYSLWRHPGILPLLHTPGIVVQKLQAGADLMTPGLAGGPPFPTEAKKGAIVAIASTDKPTVPVVIGTCQIDVNSLGSVQGAKGHAVHTLHWAGDEIWSYGASGKPGVAPPEQLEGWLPEDEQTQSLANLTADLDIDDEEDEDGGVTLENGQDTSVEQPRSAIPKDGDGDSEPSDGQAQAEVKEMTPKEIDEAFCKAFIYGVHHHISTGQGQPNFGLAFPLSQSFVMSNLIQPFLPAYTPEIANSLQIKKTSFKNIKKFVKYFDKLKVLKSKERDGHETTIIDIDFEHKEFANFKPYPLPKKETLAGTSQGRGEKATSTADAADSSVGQKIAITQYYKIKDRLLPIFVSVNATTSSLFTLAEIRPIVTTYIETENLVSAKNGKLVNLNRVLQDAVFSSGIDLDKEVQRKGSVPRNVLVDRILSICGAYHAIQRTPADGSGAEPARPKAGAAPKIKLTLETRSGNKTVTKLSGLEAYGIPPQPLADELRKTCAGSASVEQLVGSSPKAPVMEIMVQGPQRDAVLKALERRGVRGQWVEVLDKTKGKKR